MEKTFLALGFFVFFLNGSVAFAQSAETTAPVLKTEHYEISVEGAAQSFADSLGWELESRFNTYNRLFHFDLSTLTAPLKARVFTDKALYDAYVSGRLGQTRTGAVYLHYNQVERRELVVLQSGSVDDSSTLSHQAFIQFLRGFVSNPPAWMREGFAIYFSGLKYDAAAASLYYEENLAWLESVKSLGGNALTAKTILEADTAPGAALLNFQICSWALASFFLNSSTGDYFRTLTDSFMVLSPAAGAAANSQAVLARMARWTDSAVMEADFRAYLDSRKTFAGLIEDGRAAYAVRDYAGAELSFIAALEQRPRHYAPPYYLGLIYYDQERYALADVYYRSALDNGADEALASYALGLNAAAAGRATDAIGWLQRAAAVDPARFRVRANELIGMLR
jgi:tetratricopeptide (TPR) repeat protein